MNHIEIALVTRFPQVHEGVLAIGWHILSYSILALIEFYPSLTPLEARCPDRRPMQVFQQGPVLVAHWCRESTPVAGGDASG
jgi:hypothetical protein